MLRAVFEGGVQGVGFRATVKRFADRMHISGFARNCPDGSVEVCMDGPHEAIDHLLELLQEQFSISKVTISSFEDSASYPDFQILR